MNQPENPDGVSVPDELPPVKPPSAVFILQLFVVPGLIVLVIVGVWVLFGKMATSEQDWRSLVTELRHPNELRRWRAAHGLAQILKADQDLGKEGQGLAGNSEIARSLADTFTGELKKQSKLDSDLKFQSFLARTLGLFDLPDVVLPPLLEASRLEHERETGEVREQMLDVRKNALASLAVMADRLGEQHRALHSTELVDTVVETSRSEDKLVRETSAFVLGLLDGPQALERLKILLDDSDSLTQINAAIGLARHGNTSGFRVLKDVFSAVAKPAQRGSPEEFEQFVALKNGLLAVERMTKELTPSQNAEAVALVQPISEHFREPGLRVQAIKTLHALRGRK
jgi:hypothetical protein